MIENDDDKFMRRCLELASKAEGMTYPNPLVGAVVVHQGKIIGEGYHLKAGGPHAEVNAINSVTDREKLKFSTLYVNLEPCSHFGKTPPCADFILANSIPKVVVGTIDTSEKVSGGGIAKLRNAGCEVITAILEKESRRLNRRFFCSVEKKRPYITLKWAQSADGFIDIKRSQEHEIKPNWISGKPERILVHRWRAAEQAILVGAGTIRADNPGLNVREWKGNDPLKIILSDSGIFDSQIFKNEQGVKVVLFTRNIHVNLQNTINVMLTDDKPASLQIIEYLHRTGIQSLLVEGGAKVLSHFILNGLWDEARIFKGTGFLKAGINGPALTGRLVSETKFTGSSLEIYLNELAVLTD